MSPSCTLTFNYLFRVLLLLLGAATIVALLCYPTRPQEGVEQAKLQDFWQHSKTVEAITLGNSHNRAINFGTLGVEGIHLYNGGGDLREAEWKLTHLLPLLPNLKVVYVAYSPGVLEIDVRHLPGSGKRQQRLEREVSNLYRTVGVKSLVENVFPVFQIRSGIKNQIEKSALAGVFRSFKNTSKENECKKEAAEITYREEGQNYKQALISIDCISLLSRIMAQIHNDLISGSHVYFPNVMAENKQRLVAMARLLNEKGITMVLYRPPYPPQYRSALVEHADNDFIPQLMTQFCNVHFVDMSDLFDESLATKVNRYFYDADHLAYAGQQAFSKKLQETLQKQSTCEH